MTAVAIHAAIDYVAHFPTVLIFAALIIGLASSRHRLAGRAWRLPNARAGGPAIR
jgi:hypothetical protein